jgi:hypothetical protein
LILGSKLLGLVEDDRRNTFSTVLWTIILALLPGPGPGEESPDVCDALDPMPELTLRLRSERSSCSAFRAPRILSRTSRRLVLVSARRGEEVDMGRFFLFFLTFFLSVAASFAVVVVVVVAAVQVRVQVQAGAASRVQWGPAVHGDRRANGRASSGSPPEILFKYASSCVVDRLDGMVVG